MSCCGAGGMRAAGLYSAELGIYTGALWEFVGKTQIKKWNKLIELYGGDPDVAMRQFALRVASEIDSRGVLDVLRQGVKDRGVQIDLAYFRPGHTLAEDALDEYDANIARGRAAAALQLPGHEPVGGHGVLRQRAAGGHGRAEEPEHRAERRPRHRAVPAAGPERAVLRQAGPRAFRGRSGPGLHHDAAQGAGYRVPAVQRRVQRGGKGGRGGEPTARSGYDYSVSYLWEDIWQRDNWLETPPAVHARAGVGQEGRQGQPAYLAADLPALPSVARRAGDGQRTRGSTGRGRTISSSIRPGRGSRTRSRGSRTGCPTCSTTTTSRCSTRSS